MGGSPCVGWSMRRPGEGELNKCVIRISSALGCLSHIAWDLGQRPYIHTSSFEESFSAPRDGRGALVAFSFRPAPVDPWPRWFARTFQPSSVSTFCGSLTLSPFLTTLDA